MWIVLLAFSSSLSDSAEGRPPLSFVDAVTIVGVFSNNAFKSFGIDSGLIPAVAHASMAVKLDQSVGAELVLRVVKSISLFVFAIGVCNAGIHGKCGALIGDNGFAIAVC